MSQQEIKPISNREKLYNNLIETGRVSEREIGKKEDFVNALGNPSGAKYVYDNLRSKFDPEEIGDETKFLGFVTADYTGNLPAGRPGGNIPEPTQKPILPSFINTNPFLPEDKAPAPLKEKANTVNEKQQFVDVDKQGQQAAKPTVAGVEDEMGALYDKHKDELAKFNAIKQKMNIPDVDSFTGYNARESRMMGLGGLLSKAKISKEEREFYEKNKERLEDVEKQMKAMLIRRDVANLAEQQESLDPNSPGIKKFWDGLTKSGTVKDFLTMGLSTMRDDVYMIELLEKASKDKNSINPEEQKLIDSYMKLQELQSKDNGFWYGAGGSFREMVPFVINMIATGGVAGAVNLGQKAIATSFKAATKLGKKKAVEYAARKAGSLMLGNMLRTPLTTTFYTDLAKRRVGNYQQDENGDIVKGDNTLTGDLYKSYVTNTLEYMTEGFGDLVGRGALTSLLAKKRILGPMSKYVSALEKVTANPVYKKVGSVLDKAQIHGISTEIFVEEVPNALLSSLLTGSDDYKQLADPEFYGTIAVNTALMGGIFKGTQFVSGGVASSIERGKINNVAKKANNTLQREIEAIDDADVSTAASELQQSISNDDYFNPDNKSESGVINAFQNFRKVVESKYETNPEQYEKLFQAASKAVLSNAEKAGAYEGLLAIAEEEDGGPVAMKKSQDNVVIATGANGDMFYITDVHQSELGGELFIVRNVKSGEMSTITPDVIEDTKSIATKDWLEAWLQTREVVKPAEDAINAENAASLQQEDVANEQVNISEVVPGAEFLIGSEKVVVIDATEEDIFVVDRDGNEHRVEIESLQRVPPVTQEAPAADVNAVNLPIQEEVQQLPIEPVQEPESAATIEEAQQAEAGNSITGGISIPVDKQGQIDYSQIAEPKMYAEALKSEFADESLSVLEDLIAEQKEALKKAEKTINAIERRRKIKIVNTELAKLNQTKTMLSPEQDISSVQVAQESAQEISNPKPIQKPTRRPGGKRLTPMQQDLMKFGEPTTREEAIAMTILRDGIKFRMNDNKAEGIKGLAGHLGLKKGGKEYRKYFGLQNEKTGMSPEHLALYIKEMDDDGLFVNLEDSDIFTDVLEVMRKAYSRRTLFEIIETSRRDQERRFNEEDYYESEEIKSNIASKEELTEEEYEEIIDDYFSEKYVPLSEQEVSTIESLIADSVKDEERWRIINESEDLPEDESGRNIAEGVQQRGADTDVSGSPTIGNNSQDSNEGGSNESTGGRAGADEAVLQGAPVAQSEQSVNPLRKEIESLNQSKKEAIAERDKIIANNAERVGLFGDTKQDPNDLFGGEGFDPSASQPLVDNQNKIIAELDRKIEVLTKNLEQGEREAQGQLKIEEIAQEEARVNTEPTEKQKEAGNYQKGHIKLLGYDVTIEQPKGSTRSGVDKGDKEWSVTMNNTYGYILGTKGKDGEHIDVFVGENPLSEKVYVVDQVNQDGSFDEHKVMFGFDSIEDASKAYNANYEEGWQGLGNITEVSIDDFQKWTENKTRKIKPFAEYKANSGQSLQPIEPKFKFMADSPMRQARAIQALSKKTSVEGVVMKAHEFIESLEKGLKAGVAKVYSKKSEKGYIERLTVGDWIVDSKAEQDYYTYLQDGGISYTQYLSELNAFEELKKQREDSERRTKREIDSIRNRERQEAYAKQKRATIKVILSGMTQDEFLNTNDQLLRVREQIDQLRSKKNKTKNIETQIAVEENNLKGMEFRANRFYEAAKSLYEIRDGEVVEKYSYSPGDRIIVDYGDGRVDGTEYMGTRENDDGSITHIVKPTDIIINGYVSYDMIRPFAEKSQTETQLENKSSIEEGVLQPDVDNESGEPGAEMSEAELKESQETAEKLQDFGQKIGMARKDVAERGFTRTGKYSELPGWAKKYKVFQQKKGTSYADWDTKDGKYEVAIVSGNFFKTVQKNFDTPEAAASAIPLLEVARNHYVRPSSANNDEYSIYRRWSSGKLWEIKKGFKSRDEAMLHMAVNAVSIIETKDVKVERPHLDNIERIGIEIRKGNITPEQFMDTFGFRGGEFGNWVASDERQSMLNYAYDALVDLAAVINISPRALSLGGRLAIGFGSRGKGLSNAAAHFEADRGVINLTKINGAGALAHEWFHAMDSYFGVFGNQGFVPNEEGVIKSPDPSRDYLSGDYYNNKRVRDEVVKAWNGVWKAMRYKEEMAEYDISRLENKLESSKDSLVRALQNTRGWLAVDRKWGLRKKAATPEQLKSWDALIERVNNYDFGPTSKAETKKKYSFESVYEVQKKLSELTKVISGRSALGADFYSFHRVVMAKDQLEKAKSDQTYLKKVNTTFYNGSKDMDASRSSAYWSTNLEMAARGFEAYVDDKLKAVGAKNDYLVHSVNNAVYVALYDAKPYPEGQERLDINNAFDTFFSTIDEKIDEETGNTVLFRQPYFYSPTEQALNSIKQEKGTPEQFKAMLLKNGAKQAELDWMGWDDFASDINVVTKADIQDWIDQNRIEVEEVEKSDDKTDLFDEDYKNAVYEHAKNQLEDAAVLSVPDYQKVLNDWMERPTNELNVRIENILWREDLESYPGFRNNNGYSTKYSQYTSRGGENYKELLLTMLVQQKESASYLRQKMLAKYGEKWYQRMSEDERKDFKKIERESSGLKDKQFISSHWDEPNILAHVRFNERTSANGERVLFVEEIQSDWAQEGKKKGFKGDYKNKSLVEPRFDGKYWYLHEKGSGEMTSSQSFRTEAEAWKQIEETMRLMDNGVPNMPFKKTDQWVNLAFRRMMRYAAENGFDRIAWTNGEMQADRYNLSKQTDFIDYWKNDNGTYDFGLSIEFNKPSELTESELESYLGKDIANKIINDKSNPTEHNPARLEGNDLKVGGSGMKAFYDNIIPAQVNKIGKKFGAKVETTEIPAIDKKVFDEDAGERNLTPEAEELYQKYMDSVAEDDGSYPIEQYVSDMENIGYEVVLSETGYPIDLKKTYKGEVYSVQSISITPAIKEQASIGMPLYMPESGMEQVDYKDLPLETVVNTVREFARNLNTEVKIIYDTQQYPSNSRYRRAKGWFRPISGEVTIVLSKHNSINDLKTTIIHEVVGHKGLRNLLGDTFKKTMQRVFISLPKSVQADYFARYNNRVTAAEEYLSELTKYDIHPTLWQRIKGIIRDALRSVGVFINMSDADMKYMLWRSKNRLQDQAKATSIELMTDIVKSREKQSRLRSEADVLLREEREPFTLDSNDIALNKWEKTIEALQDRMVSGKKLIEEIKKRGGKVGVFSNFVSEENRSSSRAKAELDDFEDNYYKPILDIVAKWAKEGKSADEISLYMMAKHAPERNRHIVIRDARESILYGFNKDLRKAEGKRRSATAEKDIKAIDESIRNIQSQIDFINSAENAGLIAEIMRNAYDVAFNHDNRSPLPEGMDSLSYMIALNIQKRAISMLSKVAESELSNNRSGLSDEEAADIVNEFEKGLKEVKDVVMFWDNIRKATRFSLDKSLKYGLISKEVHAATSNMYEFYVPLRSWAEKEDIDYQDVLGDNYLGHEILNPVNKHAEGRTSLADNPLGFIASMAETSIVAGSKNEVRRNAWRLIKNNDHMTDLFLIKQAWEVNIADIGDEPIWETTYEPPTQELIDAGMARRLSPNKTYEWHKSRGDIEKHQVPVLIDGSRVLMEFKGPVGTRVAAAINGDDVVRWKRTEGIARLTRIMAALKTSKNPDFMLTNFLRDFFFGTMAYNARGGNALIMTKNLGRAWGAIHKDFTNGKEDPYLKQMYEDFKMNGGETGYVHMLGEQDYKKKVEKLVKEANKAGSISPALYVKKAIKVIDHGLDYLAHMSENAVRFSTYLTEVEAQMKKQKSDKPTASMMKEAALMAKEVTTNFNRKGKWSSQVNSFYAFFNASVQGSANYIKLAKENPKGFVLYNMAMMSIRTALAAWCLSLFGDDDDEKGYLALSDYIKENNFVIPAGDSKFITIPLPHGARALTNIGPLVLDVVMGKKSAAEAMDTYSKNIISELSPINLIGLDKSAFIPRKADEVLLTMLPTVVRPFAETALNMDFMSRPIERGNLLATENGYLPRFRNAYSSTNPILVGLAKELNRLGGGNDSRSAGVKVDKEGNVSRSKIGELLDVSPAYTEHIIEGYFGGLGRFVNDLYKTTRSAVHGEVPEKQNIPVVRRLYQEPYESVAWQKYFETRARVSDITMSMKAAKDTGDMEQYVSLNNYYNNSLITTFEIYNDIMKNISSNIKSLPKNDPMRKQAEKAMDKLVEQFNEEIKFIDKNHNRR